MIDGRNLPVRWVCHSDYRNTASTVMRTDQLIAIVRERIGEDTDCIIDDEQSVLSARDSILWLTKGFIRRADPELLDQLKKRRNVLCADHVDSLEHDDQVEFIDIYVAASVRQLLHFNEALPDNQSCLVSHHADARATCVQSQTSRFNIGYFGELDNARYRDELKEVVDFVPINTRTVEDDWATQLPNYSLHYAVRQPRPFDGFKPFLKGFTAAACGAAILVPLDEGDALYYLGHDYPFAPKDDSLLSVREAIKYAEESFGGPEWRYAHTIMDSVRERSSARQVAEDFKHFLAIARR